MKFVIDAQLPPALARRLIELGHEAIHVHEIGLSQSPDRAIWAHAAETGAVLISKDEDFALMRIWNNAGPAIIWVKLGNVRRRALLKAFDDRLVQLVAAIERGEKLIELTD